MVIYYYSAINGRFYMLIRLTSSSGELQQRSAAKLATFQTGAA